MPIFILKILTCFDSFSYFYTFCCASAFLFAILFFAFAGCKNRSETPLPKLVGRTGLPDIVLCGGDPVRQRVDLYEKTRRRRNSRVGAQALRAILSFALSFMRCYLFSVEGFPRLDSWSNFSWFPLSGSPPPGLLLGLFLGLDVDLEDQGRVGLYFGRY